MYGKPSIFLCTVYNVNMMKEAVLDTSFWSLVCRVPLAPYLWIIWQVPLWMPPQVIQEIGTGSYPDQTALAQALVVGSIMERRPLHLLNQQFAGHGEQEVFAVAVERAAVALINDGSAHDYARGTLELTVLSVPEFLVNLMRTQWITVTQATAVWHDLNNLGGTRQSFLNYAAQAIRQQGGML